MTGRRASRSFNPIKPVVFYDRWLLFTTMSLLMLGLLMVYSSSVVLSGHSYGQPFHYFIHQGFYLFLGLVLALGITKLDSEWWHRLGPVLLIASAGLLILVLVPGIGKQVNGSKRWIAIGPFALQVSEFAKFAFIIYMAGYLVRRDEEVKTRISGFIKPMFLLSIIGVLLLLEPDFGAMTVIMFTALGMMFLAGVRLWQFGALLAGVIGMLCVIAISSPYRMARLTTFLDPWANQYASGYQLTQSLIAFGRGSWFGVGLGESVQKLFYLPEAHTDFLFAVLVEELGLAGALVVITLFVIIVARALIIGRKCYYQENYFAAYAAYGFGLWIAFQAMINIGVNMGVLPTKGLTLPLMSYGGSSLVVMCCSIAVLLRIDHERRKEEFGL